MSLAEDPQVDSAGVRDLTRFAWLAIAASIVVIGLKAVAWRVTGSVGLMSDAIESIINLVAAVVALIALRIAAMPPDDNHHYGHAKVEYFSAMIEAGMIFVAAVAIIIAAIERLLNPQPVGALGLGVAVSVVASVVNGVVAWILIRAGRTYRSITLKADGKHLLTDVWTSFGVIVGVTAVVLTGWQVLDPLIAVAIAVNILFTGLGLLSQSIDGLMDHVAPTAVQARITAVLDRHATTDVFFHKVRTRESGHITFLSAHVTVPSDWTVHQGHEVMRALENDLHDAVEDMDVLLRLESKDLGCSGSAI